MKGIRYSSSAGEFRILLPTVELIRPRFACDKDSGTVLTSTDVIDLQF
jgi:hypothetical protein